MALTSAHVECVEQLGVCGWEFDCAATGQAIGGAAGIERCGSSLSEGYFAGAQEQRSGAGIVGETMQSHGTADRYTLGAHPTWRRFIRTR